MKLGLKILFSTIKLLIQNRTHQFEIMIRNNKTCLTYLCNLRYKKLDCDT